MPCWKTHLKVEMGLAVATAAGAIYGVREGWFDPALEQTVYVALASGYVFASLFFSPDLDLKQCRSARRWGILRFLWMFYPRLFAHRGISHHLLWGPLTRLIYLAFMLSLFLGAGYAVGWLTWDVASGEQLWQYMIDYRMELLAGLVGIYLANSVHVLLDKIGDRIRLAA
jgi:uncharacterized metal-binding protein